MYEQNGSLETRCRTAGESTADRLAECPHAERSVEAGSTQHGTGLVNSDEQTAGERNSEKSAETDVGDLRSVGRVDRLRTQQQRPEERMAPVGNSESERRQQVHPEESTDMVIEPRPEGAVSTENVMRLLRFQQFRCALTDRSLSPEFASLDHIIPVRCGGEHQIENTQVLHRDVNRSKGSLTNDEFIQLCREVVSHTAATRAHEGVA